MAAVVVVEVETVASVVLLGVRWEAQGGCWGKHVRLLRTLAVARQP